MALRKFYYLEVATQLANIGRYIRSCLITNPEMMEREEMTSVVHVKSKNNLADALTKRGASCQLLEDVLSSGTMVCAT